MQITVQGKQIDLGEALRTYATDKIEELNEKFFNHATFATVTFSPEGHGHGLVRTHISISVGKSIKVMADAVEADPYLSFDTAMAKVTHQMRRYKNRLRDHHERMERSTADVISARDAIVASNDDDEDFKGDDPVIVAEMTTDIQTMSVSEAVMRLDLAGQPALLFRNASHGELNYVYKRSDGNVGWVDPEGMKVLKEKTKARSA